MPGRRIQPDEVRWSQRATTRLHEGPWGRDLVFHRDNRPEGGVLIFVLTVGFCFVAGAMAGALLFLYIAGRHVGLYYEGAERFSSIMLAFAAFGAIIGALAAVVYWWKASRDRRPDDESPRLN